MASQVKARDGARLESNSSSSASLAKDRVEESRSSTPVGKTPSVVLQEKGSDLDEFQMYTRFRLEMVSLFGSMSSALYEFGADRVTGQISQEQFVDVCCFKLGLLTEKDANDLFVHFTNVDLGAGGFASYRDFNISDKEWNFVVQSKKDQGAAMPFSSTPSGSSAGKFHRPMGIQAAGDQPRSAPKMSFMPSSTAPHHSATTPRSQGGSNVTSITEASPGSKRRTDGSSRKRVFPWQLPQKPWIGSVFAGQGIVEDVSNQKFRPYRAYEQTFKTSGKAMNRNEPQTHRDTFNRRGDPRCLAATCPPRRNEMEPLICEKQISAWWPYTSVAPRPKLKIDLRPKAVS